jgi:hypothetical protein
VGSSQATAPPPHWIFERIKTVHEKEIHKTLTPKIKITCIFKKVITSKEALHGVLNGNK